MDTSEYDVWVCLVNGRTSYRATLVTEPRPRVATEHLDTVTATNRRSALRHALLQNRRWKQ